MADDKQPTSLDLGIYSRETTTPRITMVEVVALILSGVWLVGVLWFFFWSGLSETAGLGGSPLEITMLMLAIFMPIALIWVAASAAKTARIMREEAARLQSAIDAMRAAYIVQQQRGAVEIKPGLIAKLNQLVAAQEADPAAPATFTSLRKPPEPAEDRAAIPQPAANQDAPQPGLLFGTPPEALDDPISIADFIKALNFPENEHDKEGFRTLRRALKDPATKKLIRASQDVLTLLSQDGIYMDDLRPDRAKPEIWRRFAQGDRGKPISALGGIRDRSSLALAAGRMKQDPVFRDAVHHFLRQFDRTLVEFERTATDAEIAQMSDTRTVRAFMLMGRVTGVFD